MKTVLKLNQVLVDLNNDPLKTILKKGSVDEVILNVGRAIALILLSSERSGDPLRHYVMARKFTDEHGEVISLDETDTDFIKEQVKAAGPSTGFTNIVTGQILKILEDSKVVD